MEKTVWNALLGSMVRAALLFVGGLLLRKGVISQDELDKLLTEGAAQLTGAIIALIAVVWSFRAQLKSYLLKHVALQVPNNTTRAEVAETVKAMPLSEKLRTALTTAQPNVETVSTYNADVETNE